MQLDPAQLVWPSLITSFLRLSGLCKNTVKTMGLQKMSAQLKLVRNMWRRWGLNTACSPRQGAGKSLRMMVEIHFTLQRLGVRCGGVDIAELRGGREGLAGI